MTPTEPNPSPAAQPLVEYVRTNRATAGYVLAGLSLLLLVGTVLLAREAIRAGSAAEKPADKKLDPLDGELPELPRPADPAAAGRGQSQYHVGWIGALLGALTTGAAAAWLLAAPGAADEAKARSNARVLLLAVGVEVGVSLVVLGGIYFYLWSESLTAWLNEGKARQAQWALIPLLMVVAGAGLVFAAVQPARAEERDNAALRRVVYGANFSLTVLLLGVALVAANVLFALRVPGELDTTESGFYTVADETKAVLRRAPTSVTAYAVVADGGGRAIGDVRQFLLACQDASDGKFVVRTVSPVADKKELARLAGLSPQLDLLLNERRGATGAVLLATGAGPDEKVRAVVPLPEFFSPDGLGFVGEGRMFRELTLLADPVRPVVYFTQGSGELSLDPAAEVADDQKGERLRRFLEKSNLEVRPLPLGGDAPAVPADAAVVVVAGPRVPVPEPGVKALRAYVNTPRADGKKGKLVVLAGAVPGPGGKGVVRTGLEGLLGELGVEVGDKLVYSLVTEDTTVLAGFTQRAVAAGQPIAATMRKAVETFSLPMAREVRAAPGGPPGQVTVLMASVGPTWLEDARLDRRRVPEVIRELRQSEPAREAKQARDVGRALAVVVSEGQTPRAAVVGSAELGSDEAAKESPPDSAPFSFDLLGATIDWARERPSVAAVDLKAKQYQQYKFPDPAAVDTTRLLYLPLGLGLLAVVGLGLGVWVVRRA
ncbi:MAG: hypothetical protein C0501_05975 [Isosphaera sp.]|nr:hypothetical protein [Isosphaera sp.]